MGGRATTEGRWGFTLVEVLLALAVMGIVLAAAHEFLTGTVRHTDAVWRSADDRAADGTLAEVLRRDLSGIYLRGGTELPFALALPLGVAGSGTTMAFDTTSTALDLPDEQTPDVRRVVYRLEASRAVPGTYALYRAVRAYPGPRQEADRGTLLADGLSEFEAEAYDGAQWLKKWPPDEAKGLPGAVRVNFERAGRRQSVLAAMDLAAPKQQTNAGGGALP
jgi:type II secretion system protein J